MSLSTATLDRSSHDSHGSELKILVAIWEDCGAGGVVHEEQDECG